MKKYLRNQKGNAQVIIIVALVLALLGALGFIFWQNLTAQQNTDTSGKNAQGEDTSKVKKVAMALGSFGDAFGTKVSFTYPSNWKLNRKQTGPNPANDQDVSSDAITITSPSEQVHVQYGISNGGRGGYCDPEYMGTIESLSFENLENLAETSFVQLIQKEKDGTFTGMATLMLTTGQYYRPLVEIKAGDSICDIGYRQFVGTNKEYFTGGLFFGDINSGNVSLIYQQSKTSDIEKYFQGEEFEQAKAVLLSTVQ